MLWPVYSGGATGSVLLRLGAAMVYPTLTELRAGLRNRENMFLIIAVLDLRILRFRQTVRTGGRLRAAPLMTIPELQIVLRRNARQIERIVQTLAASPETLRQPEMPQDCYGRSGGYVVLRCALQAIEATKAVRCQSSIYTVSDTGSVDGRAPLQASPRVYIEFL